MTTRQKYRKIRFVSLFSGIGMQELGARAAFGARRLDIRAFCEVHKRTAELYTAIHGVSANRNIGDITDPNEALIDALAKEDIDILTSSFPCQSFSTIGHRKGFRDETRGGMLAATIAVVKRIRPKVIVLENVAGFTRHGGDEAARKLVTKLGYSFTSKTLNAAEYTQIPQIRNRWFAVCIRRDLRSTAAYEWPAPQPCHKTVADFIVRGVPRPRLNPTQARRIDEARSHYNPVKGRVGVVTVFKSGSFESQKVRSISGYAPSLTTCTNDILYYEVGLLSGIENLRLMGLPNWAIKRVACRIRTNSAMTRIAGNGIVVPLIARIYRPMRAWL